MTAVLPGIHAHRETVLDRHSSVVGTTVVSHTRSAVDHTNPLDPVEVSGLSAFIDSILLHPRTYVIGSFDTAADRVFLDRANDAFGEPVLVHLESMSEIAPGISMTAASNELQQIITDAFGDSAPAVNLKLLDARPKAPREYLEHFDKLTSFFVASFDDRVTPRMFDWKAFGTSIAREYRAGYTDKNREFVYNNLFRAFVLAAIASTAGCTYAAEGFRRIAVMLVEHARGRQVAATLAERLYRTANHTFLASLASLGGFSTRSGKAAPLLPLSTQFVTTFAKGRTDLLTAIADARKQLAAYREYAIDRATEIESDANPMRRRLSAYVDVVGATTAYLQRAITAISTAEPLRDGFVQKLVGKVVADFAGSGKIGSDSSSMDLKTQVSGKLVTELIAAAAESFRQSKKENDIRGLLDMMTAVASSPSHASKMATVIPVDSEQYGRVGKYLDALTLMD
jgi:hypothetical protein